VERTFLRTLENVLAIDARDPRAAMVEAADILAHAIGAEKVDVFLADPERDALEAIGTSDTPLGRKQRELGLHRLRLSAGGRVAEVFRTGERHLAPDATLDPLELPGFTRDLGIRSAAFVPLTVDGERRGVLTIASTRPNAFDDAHLELTAGVSHWLASVLHRAELLSEIARTTREQDRRAAAEDLVTILAHDFRNLLSPIAGRIALLRRRAERESREADRRDVEAAERSLRALTKLVENLLDVARIDRGLLELRREPLDLVAAAREVAGSVAMPDREVVVRGAGRLVVSADPARFRQALENLLSNAVRYTPAGASVDVSIDALGDGRAAVDVTDRGPGIASDVLPTLFARFARGRTSKGLGLGLFLAREIAVAHGGDLTVRSEQGRGTTFRLVLPAQAG
jgi:signal transduction histidine kinase